MSKELIDALIEHELKGYCDSSTACVNVQDSVKSIVNKPITQYQGRGLGKLPYKSNYPLNTLITATCSNNNCTCHIAINPKHVKLAGLSLLCKVCNSPMLLNKPRD